MAVLKTSTELYDFQVQARSILSEELAKYNVDKADIRHIALLISDKAIDYAALFHKGVMSKV